jgi:integrase
MKRSIEGSIYQSKDKKTWFARLRYTDNNGQRREKKRACATYALAKERLNNLKAEVESEKTDRKTFRQLDEFYRGKYVHKARFVGDRKLSGFRQNLDSVNYYLDAALNFFGDRFIDEIGFGDLQKFKEEIVNKPTIHNRQRSVSDTNQYLKRLRRVLNVAVEQGWLNVNPFNRGKGLINHSFEVERTRVLSYKEEERLLDQCTGKRKHLKGVIIFAIETGCRKSELLKLRWSSVNLNGRFIRIESQNSKTLRSRMVPISTRLMQVLNELWRNSPRRPGALVFSNGDFKHAFINACEKAKLDDVVFHDLRHTAITRMLEKGINSPIVMKVSGHTQQKTFLRYVNQSESSVFELAQLLDRAA